MTRAEWDRLRAVFLDALEQPAEVRNAWLATACVGDEALLREAQALLRSHETVGDFLARPTVVDPADLVVPLDDEEPSSGLEPASPKPQAKAGARDSGLGAPLLRPGSHLGAYEIIDEIGRGGMGVVYKANDMRLDRLVALKSLPEAIANRAELRERLRREARAAATITHPSVATIYALEEIDGHLLLISEYVHGPTLRSLVDRGPIDPVPARAIAVSVARALDAAHSAGVIHRDLKPENVIVSADGRAKVVDFGIAHLESDDMPRLTQTGAMLGTPAYMAPEQLLGAPVDNRTDIFAFGVMLQEMLSGQHPMAAARTASAAHADGEAGAHAGGHDLLTIANRCAQANPTARYASARDLVRDLEHGTTTTSAALPADVSFGRNSARWWWEFHQAAASLAYIAMLFAMWRARDIIGELPGRAVFTLSVAAVIVASLLRWNLLFTSRFYPNEISWVRARVGRWVHVADWAFALSLVSGALLIGQRSELDVMLISMAIGVAVGFLVIEPVTARAAFGAK